MVGSLASSPEKPHFVADQQELPSEEHSEQPLTERQEASSPSNSSPEQHYNAALDELSDGERPSDEKPGSLVQNELSPIKDQQPQPSPERVSSTPTVDPI
mmetsp:Transcript_41838/g.63993  ORF Transcript_41838/g.63993 Transcript_41838/m.63993 type:complete len:100 (+) Transcript_41838:6036-6335(+)